VDAPRTIRPGDGLFPPSLLRADPPPALLRLRGSLGRPRARVALVGSRRTDEYGREMARRLAVGLARAGVSVVSGAALGVDGAAHQAALDAGGHTVAVLACGVDVAAPPSHRQLLARILGGGGALLSEHEDGMPPAPWTFPHRNRLVAALSDAVVVVRAGPESGALITAEQARRQGVPVLAVPGDADQELSMGPIALLRAGSRVAAGPGDLLALLGLEAGTQAELPLPDLAAEPRALLAILRVAPRHADELASAAGLGPAKALAGLLELELAGLAEQRPGLRFSRRTA
jgi:DNA processing protein